VKNLKRKVIASDGTTADFTMGLESNDFVSCKIELHPAGGASIWQAGHLKLTAANRRR